MTEKDAERIESLERTIEALQEEVRKQNDCLWVEGILRQYDNEEMRVLASRVGWLLGDKGGAEAVVGAKQTRA